MKRTIVIATALLVSFTLQLSAQEKDSVRVKFGKRELIIVEDENENAEEIIIQSDSTSRSFDLSDMDKDGDDKHEFEGHWHGFEFGFNGLLNSDHKKPASENPMSINMARSWTFGLNLLQHDIPIIKENFGLVTGLGMQWRNYHFENNVEPYKSDNGTLEFIEVSTQERNFDKNRLQATYLTGVVAFEFQTPVGKEDSEFFMLAGAYGNFRMGSNLKQKWDDGGNKQKNKDKGDFYLNDLEYGLTGRIGIGDINFFANYSLTPLFKDDKLPSDWYPLTVGLMIVGFN